MNGFSFLTAGQILFGRGKRAEAIAHTLTLGRRVLLIRGASVAWADEAIVALRTGGADVLGLLGQGEPDLVQLEAGLAAGREFGAEVVIAIGGGSVIDLGKALAALIPGTRPPLAHLEVVGDGLPLDKAPLPFIAVPTTSGTGAEVTKNAVIGIRDQGRKVSLRDNRMLADLAVVDPALTDGCPKGVTLASGLDAIVQVVEPYLSRRANVLTDALCVDAIPRGLSALMRLMEGEDKVARDDMALVSLFGGLALANAGLGAVHGLAGVIGGVTPAPHGVICGRLLVPVLRANRAAAGDDLARYDQVERWISDAMGCAPVQGLDRLEDALDLWGLPRLGGWLDGHDLTGIATAAQASSSMAANPYDLEAAVIEAALRQAL